MTLIMTLTMWFTNPTMGTLFVIRSETWYLTEEIMLFYQLQEDY